MQYAVCGWSYTEHVNEQKGLTDMRLWLHWNTKTNVQYKHFACRFTETLFHLYTHTLCMGAFLGVVSERSRIWIQHIFFLEQSALLGRWGAEAEGAFPPEQSTAIHTVWAKGKRSEKTHEQTEALQL